MTGGDSSGNYRSRASNALSHVYIQYPPLRCHSPGSRFFYDDGNKIIFSLTSNQACSWKISPYDPCVTPASDPISDGPVLSIRYSFDLRLLAVQRSSYEIQIWNKETGDTFSQKCRPESERILGFFWSDCPSCNIIFVKTSGLDFYVYNSCSRSLELVETKKMNISWYVYTHESRLVLLASGMQCKSVTGYQLSSAGIIRLPKFDMVMAKSEVNNRPILSAEDVHIITVYGRIYCMQLDRLAMLLHVYRFYRDAVVQQGSIPVYSSRIGVSVIDNVLLVHQVEAKVVILYDFFEDSQAPISAPLPLLLRGFYRPNVSVSQSAIVASGPSDSENPVATELETYGDLWIFLVPDLVCDVANCVIWKIRLDLEAISASSSEVPVILEFLQRRKLEAEKAKQLCLSIIRTNILERKPVFLIAKALDVLLIGYSHAIKTGSYYKRIKVEETSPSSVSNLCRPEPCGNVTVSTAAASPTEQGTETDTGNGSCNTSHLPNLEPDGASRSKCTSSIQQLQLNSLASEQHQFLVSSSAATSTADLHTFVFAPVEEEMARDGSYLSSILVEFLRRSNQEKLKVQTVTYALMVQILCRDERYSELGLFITNKIIEPSKEVAFQLLESGFQNKHTRKLGMEMLRQLSLHHDYVLLLVQEGHYLEALRYARKNKVTSIRPSLFLEAAHATKDSQQVASVLRFFSDFVPSFNNTIGQ